MVDHWIDFKPKDMSLANDFMIKTTSNRRHGSDVKRKRNRPKGKTNLRVIKEIKP